MQAAGYAVQVAGYIANRGYHDAQPRQPRWPTGYSLTPHSPFLTLKLSIPLCPQPHTLCPGYPPMVHAGARRLSLVLLGWSLIASLHLHAGEPRPAAPAPADTASRVDAMLVRRLPPAGPVPTIVDDATFLRRISLDLTGK